MKLVVLSGPPAAGKNTIADLYAQRVPKCAVIDVDQVRWMLRQPHKAPWDGEEGHRQQLLGIHHTCTLARSFAQLSMTVLILDVLTQESLDMYKHELAKWSPKIILLLPVFNEIQIRNSGRKCHLTDKELRMLYEQETRLTGYDLMIDNTHDSAEDVVQRLLKVS